MFKTKVKTHQRAIMIALAVLLALTAIAGATYAWFTTSVQTGAQSANMGRLKVESTFDDSDASVFYEPGIEFAKEGTLKNSGSLPSFVKISANPSVLKRSDANGNPITPGAPVTNDPNVTCTFDPDKLGYCITGTDGADSYFWYKDSAGNYYVLLDGKANPEVALNVLFNGAGMGNDYQGAEIYLESQWKATQALPAAISDELDVDFDDLEFVANDLSAKGKTRSAKMITAAQAEQMARDIINGK